MRSGAPQLARHALEPAKARLLALAGPERAEDLALGGEAALGAARSECAQHLEERPERGRPLRLPAAPGEPAHAAAARLLAELFERARLPDAGLAHDQRDAAAPCRALFERSAQRLQRVGAAHEGRPARALGAGAAAAPRFGGFGVRHEAVAAPVHGLDHPRPLGAVAQRTPRGGDAARQHAVAHRGARPQRSQQLRLRNHALAVAEQVQEHVEGARLELRELAAAAQLVALLVELAVGEAPDHPGRCRRLAASTARIRSAGTSSATGSSGPSKACLPSETLRR